MKKIITIYIDESNDQDAEALKEAIEEIFIGHYEEMEIQEITADA